ncbi:SpaA isopeptide-forming pilin-related protein [Streptomyces sp. NPDC001604]|uniref:SpaA isopeptide-forming pilin-related protein n=1 Tax=Streptomyces sp. NPDC001604 TaxID=3364593 RepID=UPI0036C94318
MRIRSARTLPVAVAVAATVTGSLSWAPTASAQSTDPTPSASTSPTPRNAAEPETGGVAILKKDPTGDVLAGASFTLLDSAGTETATGKTDTQGKLAFTDLAPGVYRLKETSSGSNLYDTVDDQDVIVTPGTDTPITIVDPFKAAKVLLQAKDYKTGKLLPGATVNIGAGTSTLLTLTTGAQGTASGELPMSSRKTLFWAKEIKAPAGYDLYKPAKTFTTGPGAPVTVTVTNAKTDTTPKPAPTEKPTGQPTGSPATSTDNPTENTPGTSKLNPTATDTPDTASSPAPTGDGTESASPKTAVGSLAHTGADATPWLLAGAGLLVTGGIGAVVVARRRTDSEPEQGENAETN